MAYISKSVIALTAGTSTAGTVQYSSSPLNGYVVGFRYVRPAAAQISSTGVITITSETAGLAIWSAAAGGASVNKYPVGTAVNTTNGALTSYTKIPLYNERVRIAVGRTTANNQTGTVQFFVEGA